MLLNIAKPCRVYFAIRIIETFYKFAEKEIHRLVLLLSSGVKYMCKLVVTLGVQELYQ